MNPRLQSVCALCWLFFLFKPYQVASILMDDDGFCGFSDAEKDLCSAYCYKSVKPPLAYIIELKEQLKLKSEEHLERDKENKKLRQRLLELSDFREQFIALNQQIEELRKTNEILRKSDNQKPYIEKTEEDIKLKVKELNECVTNRNNLKKEIELEIKSRIEMEEMHKVELDNLKKESDSLINEFEAKSIKESSNYKAKEEIFNNEIQDLKSQVSSYKKQLEETQNQLTHKNILVESNSLKIKTIEKDLGECKDKLPKTGCKGLLSGIHTIELPGLDPFSALCNGEIDNGGWIVIQKRFDGSEDFYRNWTEYHEGFGKSGGEFFLGLESLHRITNSHRFELYIQIEYFNGTFHFARYNNFKIGNKNEKYKLQSIGEFSGTTRNVLTNNLGGEFSTYDQDNDQKRHLNMAEIFRGGWFYTAYLRPNPNGVYYESGREMDDSMNWASPESLKSMQMLIQPNFTCFS